MAVLKGMIQIKNYAQRSEATVIDWWQTRGFPMAKISTGVWESDTDLIDAWRKAQINGVAEEVTRPVVTQMVKRAGRSGKRR